MSNEKEFRDEIYRTFTRFESDINDLRKMAEFLFGIIVAPDLATRPVISKVGDIYIIKTDVSNDCVVEFAGSIDECLDYLKTKVNKEQNNDLG